MKRIMGPSMKPEDSLSDTQYRMSHSMENSRLPITNEHVKEEEEETDVVGRSSYSVDSKEGLRRK